MNKQIGYSQEANYLYQILKKITRLSQVLGNRNFPEYTDNAAAKAAGLTNGSFYRTGDVVKIVHD